MLKHLKARNLKQLGQQIRRIRKARGFSQADLAEKVGVRQATISDIENGNHANAKSLFPILLELGFEITFQEIKGIGEK